MFQDRLVNNEDRSWFETMLQSKISGFEVNLKDVLDNDTILYGDFTNPNADPKLYEEITDVPKVSTQPKYNVQCACACSC